MPIGVVMSNPFFDHPILNSPYASPTRHWELDDDGQPTQKIEPTRRRAKFITPIPKPKKRKKVDFPRFSRHLIMSKLKRSESNEWNKIYSGI